jgi:hypothetical protein
MSYTLKIGDKEVGKVNSIKTPQLKEVAKQTKGIDFEGWFVADLIKAGREQMQVFCENIRKDYVFSLLNPEE